MFPAQPDKDMDDIKLPPHVLEHLDNSQLSAGSDVYYYTTPLHPFRQRQLEQMVVHFRSERLEVEQTVELLHREVGLGKEAEGSGTAN